MLSILDNYYGRIYNNVVLLTRIVHVNAKKDHAICIYKGRAASLYREIIIL